MSPGILDLGRPLRDAAQAILCRDGYVAARGDGRDPIAHRVLAPTGKPSAMKVHQGHSFLGSRRRSVDVAAQFGIAAFANADILFHLDAGCTRSLCEGQTAQRVPKPGSAAHPEKSSAKYRWRVRHRRIIQRSFRSRGRKQSGTFAIYTLPNPAKRTRLLH